MIFFSNQIQSTVQNQIAAFQSLAKLGYAGAEKLVFLNAITGRAALDNSTHHIRNLVYTKDVADLTEFQMQAIQPAVESVNIYARQAFRIGTDVSSNF
jgi:phasin family protein